MTAAVANNPPAPQQSAPQQPRQANEQSLKRFKGLVEREPEPAEPQATALEPQPPAKRRADLHEAGGGPAGDKARPLAAPAAEPPSPSSDAGDRIAELQKASELSLGLDRAHARPTATQLLLSGNTAIAGGTISQIGTSGAMDIAIQAGSHLLTSDTLDALRRRLAARGLSIGQIRFAQADEEVEGV